jgi:hypothetical protein
MSQLQSLTDLPLKSLRIRTTYPSRALEAAYVYALLFAFCAAVYMYSCCLVEPDSVRSCAAMLRCSVSGEAVTADSL